MAAFSIPHVAQAPELNTDPHSAPVTRGVYVIEKDCTHQINYSKLKTEVRVLDRLDLYLLSSALPRFKSLAARG
jgi:hypothetical protein